MATLSQLMTLRATAGARYAAAVAELHASLVDLAALDRVVRNRNVNPAAPEVPRTFNDPPQGQGTQFTHPDFAPGSLVNWRDEIMVQSAVYLAAATPG